MSNRTILPNMKRNLAPLLYTAALAGSLPSYAQLSQPFSGLNPGDETAALPLNVAGNPGSLYLNTLWSVTGGSITPATDTPRENLGVPNQETYTITIPNLVLKVWSDSALITGIVSGDDPGFTSISGDPSYISLGLFQYEVTLTMPAGTQGTPYSAINFPPPNPVPVTATKNAVFSLDTGHSLSTANFQVKWYVDDGFGDPDGIGFASGDVIVDGGKGVANSSVNYSLGGNVSVVPEPGTYVLLAGLGLIGFAGWRRYNRTTEVA